MIIKSYDLKKLDLNKNNIILFYGQNSGAKEEEISNILKIKNKLTPHYYEEKEVIYNFKKYTNAKIIYVNAKNLFNVSRKKLLEKV